MVIFRVLTICGGVIRQYGNFYQNYNNFSKIVFSVYSNILVVILVTDFAWVTLGKSSSLIWVETIISSKVLRICHVWILLDQSD